MSNFNDMGSFVTINLDNSQSSQTVNSDDDLFFDFSDITKHCDDIVLFICTILLAFIGIAHMTLTGIFFSDRCKDSIGVYGFISGGIFTMFIIILAFSLTIKRYSIMKLVISSIIGAAFLIITIFMLKNLADNSSCFHDRRSSSWIINLSFGITYAMVIVILIIISGIRSIMI